MSSILRRLVALDRTCSLRLFSPRKRRADCKAPLRNLPGRLSPVPKCRSPALR